MSAFKEQVTNLFNERICRFLESCKKESYGDKLIEILNKRIDEGILPRENYCTNIWDYTHNLGDLIPFLQDFDELYYPKKLVTDEVSLKLDTIIENLKKLCEFILSLNSDNFDSPDTCFIFFTETGKTLYQFNINIKSILYESKKDLFIRILHKKVNNFFSKLNIKQLSLEDIDEILKKDNKDNSIHFELYSLKNYLTDNHEKVESIFSNKLMLEKIINSTKWYVYSYEMRFYDNFLQIKKDHDTLFEQKLEELGKELEKKFTIIKTIELDDGTVEEETINLLEKAYEFYENLENKFHESVESKIESTNSSSEDVEIIISQEIDNIIFSLDNMTPMRETMIREYLGLSCSLITLNQTISKLIDFLKKNDS